MRETAFSISPLTKQHQRENFYCGEMSLDSYLRTRASQDIKRYAAVAYVLTHADDESTILGYYTLSATTVQLESLPESLTSRLPRYPRLGATLLGRLAVASSAKGQGHGARLLKHALRQSLEGSRRIASVAVVVDALHDEAKRFYMRYGFIPMPAYPLRLFLPMTFIAASIGDS